MMLTGLDTFFASAYNLNAWVLGILIAIKGIIALIQALGQKKKKVLAILFPILTIVVGLLLAFAWGSIANIVLIVGGILLIVSGVLGLIGAIK